MINRRQFFGMAAASAASSSYQTERSSSDELLDPVQAVLRGEGLFNVLHFAPAGLGIDTGEHDATSAWRAARDAAVAAGGGIVFAPAGTYLVDELTFDFDGLIVCGAGKGRTILRPRSDDQCIVRWSLSKGRLSDLTLDGENRLGTVGLGVLPMVEDGSGPLVHQNWNLIQNVEVRRCDEGLVLRAGPDVQGADSGCWYNTFVACEAQDCLRGLWLRSPTNEGGSPPNRNAWFSLRIGNAGGGRANTGVQIDAGDTNDFFRLSCEGVQFERTPNGTPTALKVGRVDPLTGAENHYNRVFGFNCEACACDVENDNPTLELHGAMIVRSRCAGAHPLGGLFLHGASEAAASFPAPRIAPSAWREPSPQNRWTHYGSGYQSAGYYRDVTDRVQLRGVIAGGATSPSTVLFTLPLGYRPTATEVFTVDSNGGSCLVEIAATGEVRLATRASSARLSLSGVSFRTS